MKAILHGKLYHVLDDYGEGLILHDDEDEQIKVPFGNPALIVDPTDDQVDAARKGLPIPDDPDDMEIVWPDGHSTRMPDELQSWEAKALVDIGCTVILPLTPERERFLKGFMR